MLGPGLLKIYRRANQTPLAGPARIVLLTVFLVGRATLLKPSAGLKLTVAVSVEKQSKPDAKRNSAEQYEARVPG